MDYYNAIPVKTLAGNVAYCMGIDLPERFAPPVEWAMDALKARLKPGSAAFTRAVLYHSDAIPMYIWQQHPSFFAPVYQYTSLVLPMLSTVESVTPVSHASMYTGVDPSQNGIETYIRPRLECDTLYDVYLRAGLKPAIIATEDSSFLHIFSGRDMDYFAVKNAVEADEVACRLIAEDKYDLISIHTFDYDSAAHAFCPTSKEAFNAACIETEVFGHLAQAAQNTAHRGQTLLFYGSDHGQHEVAGKHGAHGSKMIEDMNILHFYGVI